MNMPRNKFAVAVAFITLAAGFIFMAGYAANAPMPPAVIGVVDLEKVYNNLDSRSELVTRIEAMQAKMAEDASSMQEELEMLSAELESLAPGSGAMIEMNDKAISISGRLRAFETYGALLIERERAADLRESYDMIRTEAGTLSKIMDIDLVLLNDSIPMVDLADAAGTLQQISARRVLWANETLDITDELIARLNGQGG
jgi:Skp family chaperone for outer membrane proteins